jgi:hypothetical protein
MRNRLTAVALGLALIVLTASTFAADSEPPASSEVTAAMQSIIPDLPIPFKGRLPVAI